MLTLHDSFTGKVLSCAGALSAGWGTFFATAQSIAGLAAGIAATAYSLYMLYDLWDRRRKQK